MKSARILRNVLETWGVILANLVEGDPKTLFSIATTLRCRYYNSFPLTAPLYPSYIASSCWVLSKEVSSIIFWVFCMTRREMKTRFPMPLENTLLNVMDIAIPVGSEWEKKTKKETSIWTLPENQRSCEPKCNNDIIDTLRTVPKHSVTGLDEL